MKTIYLKVFITVFLSLASNIYARPQDKLSQTLASIRQKVQDVQIDKIAYKQSIEILDDKQGKLRFITVQEDEKGKSNKDSYEFYLSDIDKNTVIRKTSGKKLFISLSTNNSQKFIRYYKDDKPENYTNNLEILLSNADAAGDLADLFKTAIPLAGISEKSWNTSTEALNWLKSNISKISAGQATIEQVLAFTEPEEYLVSITVKKTDQKNVSTEEKYEFNLFDLDTKDLGVKISGAQVTVPLQIKGNEHFIKKTEDNEQQNYTNEFEIIAGDIEQARNITSAFLTAIEKGKPLQPDFSTLQKSLDFIAKNTTGITIEKKTIDQKISFTPGNGTKSVFTSAEPDSKGTSIEDRYEFYLNDIDANSVNFKVSGRRIEIVSESTGKTKLFKYFKDNELQNFQNEVDILSDDIEKSREMVLAIKSAVKNSETQPVAWKNTGDAIAYLIGAVKGEAVASDKYQLTFSSVSTDPLHLKYVEEKTDSKGTGMDESYDFYPYMLDPGSVKISSSGKFLYVEAEVSNKKPFIKVTKENNQQSFEGDIPIMAFDARQAHGIADAVRYLAGNNKPKDRTWSDKQSAIKFISENIGDTKVEGKIIKQKIEQNDSDPCKISYTITSTDEKGKSSDEVYEFGLNDINRQLVDFKVSGRRAIVTLTCNNKEKLVKVYKNGAQQAWGTDVELETDDVETARNISSAFRSLIAQCEK